MTEHDDFTAPENAERTKMAFISKCGAYRYLLARTWDRDRPHLPFIMLNPSTADHDEDDPTIRRCIGFAKREGFGGIVVVNLFALRSTDPAALFSHPDPVGPLNDEALEVIADDHDFAVAAWGAHLMAARRRDAIKLIFPRLKCLGRTKHGEPRHPLYVRSDAPLEAYP